MHTDGFKSMLKQALSAAVSNFQDSGDPNDACIKAANWAGFTAKQAERLVETFNTARVICNYKSAADKASSCSLADKAVVIGGLAPASEEKEAEAVPADYSWYSGTEVDHYGVREVKVASASPSEEGLSRENADYLAMRSYTSCMDLAKEAESEARIARVAADELAMKVADALTRDCSVDSVHRNVATLVHAYATDARYAAAVDKVAEFLPPSSDPSRELLDKTAESNVIDTGCIDRFVPAIKEAADLLASAAAMDAYADEMRKLADGRQSSDSRSGLFGGVGKGLDSAKDTAVKSIRESAESGASAANDFRDFTITMRDAFSSAYRDDQQRRSDESRAEIDNLRRQLVLQDLLVRDQILSQEDPTAVIRAYRGVVQVSPESALNKEVLRSVLRSAVKGVALSPYDAKTLAELDEKRNRVSSIAE